MTKIYDKTFRRVIAIGDIHGCLDKLKQLWEMIKFVDGEDLVIFLGDYVDRGPKPVDCLKYVKHLVEANTTVVTLLGNHDALMLDYFSFHGNAKGEDGNVKDIWLAPANGGLLTLKQLKQLPQEEQTELLDFVGTLPMMFSYKEYVFVHAGLNPASKTQSVEDLLWSRMEFLTSYKGDKTIVVGHTPVSYLGDYHRPLKLNNILMVDTGAAYGHRLSAVDVLSKKVWQSD